MNSKNWIGRHCGGIGKYSSLAAMSMMLWLVLPAAHAATATTAQLQTNETTVTWGKPVLLTAQVTVGSAPVTAGHVLFCNAANATAQLCQGPQLLGQGQLTSSGTAAVNFRLGVGTHSVKALYQGTAQYAASTSAATTVTVTGAAATVANLTASGSAGNYTFKATVNGLGNNAIAGTVDFNLTTGTKNALGTATLGSATQVSGLLAQGAASTGTEPIAMAAGDFNGDGIPDLAVANLSSASLTILLGTGTGSYTPTTQVLTTGAQPSAIAVGDFNDDGKLDFIVAAEGANALYEFLGNGDGTFQAPTAPINEAGAGPVGIVVGDFNSDGQQDLAIVNQGSSSVVILFGNGQGGFAAGSQAPLATDQMPYAIAIGDFNNDGKPDLVIPNYYGMDVTVFLGNGDGTFTQTATQSVGVYPTALAVGDFNGDGNLDMAVTNSYSKTISILLGNGQGGFTAQSETPATELNPDSIAVADFNGDGKLDLAVANSNSNSVDLFFGNGNGTFAASMSTQAGSAPYSIVAADMNGDGLADVAVADAGSSQVEALLNMQGTAAVATLSRVSIPGGAMQSVQASYVGTSTLMPSQSNVVTGLAGTLITTATTETVSTKAPAVDQALQIVATISPASVGAVTPTGQVSLYDGATLVSTIPVVNGGATFNQIYPTSATHSLTVHYSGDANFTASQSAATAVTVATPATSATTLAASAATVAHGTLVTLTATVTSGGKPVTAGMVKFCKASATYCEDVAILRSAQLNASGQAVVSLALPVGADAVKAVFAGTGAIVGSSSAATTVTVTGTYPVNIALTNSTAGGSTTGGVYATNVALTNGSWQALPASPLNLIDTTNKNLVLTSTQLPASVSSLVAGETINGLPTGPFFDVTGDFNGDGKMDVAIANSPSPGGPTTLTVLLSNGNGTFSATLATIALGQIYGMAAGDFNGDGKMDLALADHLNNQVTILQGNGDGTFTLKENIATVTNPQGIAVGDFNNDGNADVVVASNQGAGMSVLLGKGDGTFKTLPVQSTNGAYGVSIAVADFNGDGFPDLLMSDSSLGAQVAYGNGEGAFQTPQGLLGEFVGSSVAVGDFNGDGRPDAVIGAVGQVVILFNQPGGSVAGSFEPASNGIKLSAGNGPINMVVVDMNGDGLPDLVIADQYNASLEVDYNQGNGSFRQAPQSISGQNLLGFVAVGDFDLDGGPDLMVPETASSSAAVLLNRGTNHVQFSGVAVPGSGAHLIQATTPAGGVYTAGTSNTLSLTAAPVTAKIGMTTSPSTGIVTNQQVNVVITVPTLNSIAPTGTVSLYQGATLIKTSALTNGILVVPMSFTTVGQITLTAKYNGDANLGASSISINVNVASSPILTGGATASTSTLTASSATPPLGTPITLTAVDKDGQTVDFRLSKRRDVEAAKAFFNKAIPHEGRPSQTITLDGYAASHRGERNEERRPATRTHKAALVEVSE